MRLVLAYRWHCFTWVQSWQIRRCRLNWRGHYSWLILWEQWGSKLGPGWQYSWTPPPPVLSTFITIFNRFTAASSFWSKPTMLLLASLCSVSVRSFSEWFYFFPAREHLHCSQLLSPWRGPCGCRVWVMGTCLFLELWLISTWTELRRVALKSLDLCTYYLATSMLRLIRYAPNYYHTFCKCSG